MGLNDGICVTHVWETVMSSRKKNKEINEMRTVVLIFWGFALVFSLAVMLFGFWVGE
jgi:hypothetical protein